MTDITTPEAPAPRYTGSFDAEGDGILTVVVDGKAVTFTSEHPRWAEIIDDVTHGRMPSDTPFEVLLENVPGVKVTDGVLTIDGYPVHSDLADTIRRYHREGRDTDRLAKFAARLQENPNEESRNSLFTWAGAKDMTINEDGYLIGFKSVSIDFRSHHVGPAIVDGEEYDPDENDRQGVPNRIGSVVELDREQVDADNSVGCSTGLHFGTWDYAKRFGYNNVVMEVKVDPADVVSVPTDSSFQKVRCCRYEVLAIHDANGALARYEAEATKDPVEDIEAGLAAQGVPPTFLERIINKFRART